MLKLISLLVLLLSSTTLAVPFTTVSGIRFNSSPTGILWFDGLGNISASADTSAIVEGSKLFFTNGRAQSAMSGLYEAPITFSTGLTRSTNTITVNTSQNIAKLSNLTTNGFVKTSGGDGTMSVDTTSYTTTARTISTTSPVTGGGDLSANRTIAINQSNTSTNGYLSSTDWNEFNTKTGSVTYTPSTPARTLSSNFTPSASDAVNVCYTVRINCTIGLVSPNCEGSVELRSDTNATPTTNRGRADMTVGGGLVLGLTLSDSQESQICYIVPPNHNVRLVTTQVTTGTGSTPTFSITAQSETAIAFGP